LCPAGRRNGVSFWQISGQGLWKRKRLELHLATFQCHPLHAQRHLLLLFQPAKRELLILHLIRSINVPLEDIFLVITTKSVQFKRAFSRASWRKPLTDVSKSIQPNDKEQVLV
jgi:hypothetical protein